MTPVFGIVGWKSSGKTTLVTRLVAEFTARGVRVATAKHAHHGFDIDSPGTDSDRHRKAGAREVLVISSKRWALIHEGGEDGEPRLRDLIGKLSACDLILVEGFKREPHPKIEARRKTAGSEPALSAVHGIVAVAGDEPTQSGKLPFFDMDDISGIADFIADHVDLSSAGPMGAHEKPD